MPRPSEEAQDLSARFGHLAARDIIEYAAHTLFPGSLALMTSFGAESAILLHLVSQVDRSLPVLFADTRRLFPETLAYRDTLIDHLGLTDVRTVALDEADEAAQDPVGALFALDPDRCCHIRKVVPMDTATAPFAAWITGRKRFQGATRSSLPVFDADGDKIRVNPLAAWSARDVLHHLTVHRLPRHPLVAQGYLSIGCQPCTTPVREDEDPRAGRWRGHEKTECGLHVREPDTMGDL